MRANPHEDEIISGGLSRIKVYNKGFTSTNNSPKTEKLEVIRENKDSQKYLMNINDEGARSRRSLSMIGGGIEG